MDDEARRVSIRKIVEAVDARDRFHTILVYQYHDELVVRETCYWAAPFQAPAWRPRWVEPVPASASN